MIHIAIDGPGGAGKSTVSKAVAAKLGIVYVDTGALYRTVGYYVRKMEKNPKSAEEVTSRYESFSKTMLPLLLQGLSGAIYTQTTDVEGEINGLVTYDRKVIKVDVKRIHDINQKVINSLK